MLHVALSAPASKRPVSKHIMTLGLDRKAASSDSATASQTSSYSSVQGKTKDVPGTALAKPKTLLSCKCTELKADGLSIIHNVQLLLTSYREVLVIKKGDKSRNQTVLRRHSVLTDYFMEHSILTSALQVQVPHTLLRYVYQFEKEKTLRQWLERIGTCRKEGREVDKQDPTAVAAAGPDVYSRNGMISNQSATALSSHGDESEPLSPTRQIPKRRDASKLKLHDFEKSSPHAGAHYRQGPGSPEPRPRVQSMVLNYGRPKSEFLASATGSLEDPSPASCRPSSSTGHRELSGSTSGKGGGANGQETAGVASHDVASDTVTAKDVSSVPQDSSSACSVGSTAMGTRESVSLFTQEKWAICSKDVQEGGSSGRIGSEGVCGSRGEVEPLMGSVCSPPMVVTVSEASPSKHSSQQMGRPDNRGLLVGVEVVMTPDVSSAPHSPAPHRSAPHSPACLSRNSSARSSDRSAGAGSARSLNLAVLQESLELSCSEPSNMRRYSTASDHDDPAHSCNHRREVHRRYSTSSDRLSSCSNHGDAQHLSSSSSRRGSSDGGGNHQTHHGSRREHMGLNLSDKRNSFVRRAGDQLVGLLKMHSFRERERRKGSYVRISSSVSELDTMLSGDRDLDRDLHFHTSPARPRPKKKHSPTTPTSPLAHSHALSPSSSPVFAGEIPVVSPEGEEDEEEGGAFLVSRFHHTQIRNQKRKQSPRIRRAMSTEQGEGMGNSGGGVAGVGGAAEASRSTSESPITTAARALYQRMELYQSLDNRHAPVESPIRDGCATPPAQPAANTSNVPNGYAVTSSTLPRIRGRKGKIVIEAGNSTPNSPIASHNKFMGSKSPKILTRIFHRRQSSSSIKVLADHLDISRALLDSDLSSSFSLDSAPKDHTPPKKLHQFPAKDVARELTLMDSQMLRDIRPEELQDLAWTKKGTKEEKAPHVLQMVRAFNQLALLVPTEVLSETTPHARAKVISSFIQIAHRCYSQHNYNSLKAVLAGLQCTPIYRLDKTWKEVNSKRKKRFEQLSSLMSEDENWQLYRRKIEGHIATRVAFIPFLGMFLTQVVQNDSYHQIRQFSSPKGCRSPDPPRPMPAHPGHAPPSDHLQVTPLGRIRKRSASLGDCSPTSTITPHSIHVSPLACEEHHASPSANRFSYVVKEEDAVFTDDPLTRSLEEGGGGNKRGSRIMSYPSPVINTYSDPQPSIEVDACGQSGKGSSSGNGPVVIPSGSFDEPDFVFDPLREQDMEGSGDSHVTKDQSMRSASEDDLDLTDISFAFRRRSLSFESLLDSFKGNRKFQHLFRDSAHMSSLQSLADSDDDESDQEGEGSSPPNADSSMIEISLLDTSFSDLESSSLSCSFNASQLSDLRDRSVTSGVCDAEDPLPDDSRLAKSLSYDDSVALKFNHRDLSKQHSDDACPLPGGDQDRYPSTSQDPLPGASQDTCPLPIADSCPQEDRGVLESRSLERFDRSRGKVSHMKRSKSQDSASRNAVQRKAARAKNNVPARKPKQATSPVPTNGETSPTLGTTPTDMLIQFQIASMGCVMGVGSRVELRTVVKESETNTEKDNYSISYERE